MTKTKTRRLVVDDGRVVGWLAAERKGVWFLTVSVSRAVVVEAVVVVEKTRWNGWLKKFGWSNSDGGAAGIYSGAAAGDLTGNTAGTQRTRREPRSHLTRPYPPALVVFSSCMACGRRASVGPRISEAWAVWPGGGSAVLGESGAVRLGGFEI